MTTPTDRMLERVRALLQQAEHPGTGPEEAQAFAERAAEIMARYGIDQALVAEQAPTKDVPTSVRIDVDNPYSTEKATLLTCIAQASRCQVVLHTRGRITEGVTIFGFRADLDRTRVLFASLLVQATRGLTRDVPWWELREDTPNARAAYRRSWLVGFAHAVSDRLQAAEKRAERSQEGGTGTALVLSTRADRVALAKAEAFPELGKARKRSLSGTGYHSGVVAGRTAQLDQPGLTSRDRGRIGGAS